MSGVTINMSELKNFAKYLRNVEPRIATEFNRSLTAAGELVADEARARSSWSSRIPGSIHTQRRGLAVRVVAGGAPAPDGAPYEHGGSPGEFRHPVFGNRQVWVAQQARPFLGPAAAAKVEQTAALVVAGVDRAFSQVADAIAEF